MLKENKLHSTKISEIEVKDDSVEQGINMEDSAEKHSHRDDIKNK